MLILGDIVLLLGFQLLQGQFLISLSFLSVFIFILITASLFGKLVIIRVHVHNVYRSDGIR